MFPGRQTIVKQPEFPLPKFFAPVSAISRQTQQTPGFNVFTRVGGQKTLIAANLPFQDAVNFGQWKVGQTARASFKVIESGAPATGGFSGRGRPETFKEGKDGWTIEKRKYRISSPGEKQEITFKGLFAQSTKRAAKSIFRLGK